MRLKFALPKKHLAARVGISLVGATALAALTFLLTEAAAADPSGQRFFALLPPDEIREGALMMLIGLICAIGSAVSTWIYVPGMTDDSNRSVLSRAATGFVLGSFGGLAAIEYAIQHNALGLSAMAIAGVVAGIISVFGSLVLQVIYAFLRKKSGAPDGADEHKEPHE